MRPARPAAARRDRPGPRATAADGRAGCDEATRPATDRGAPSHRASRRERRGGRWSDARSWLVLNGKGVGALPAPPQGFDPAERREAQPVGGAGQRDIDRSEEHTSELQSLMRISYAVFCLKKQKKERDSTNDETEHKK